MTGDVIEIGDLDGIGRPGIRVVAGNGQEFTVYGFSRVQLSQLADLLFERASIVIRGEA